MLMLFVSCLACADVTYNLASQNYDGGIDYTPPCQAPACVNYTKNMRMTGSFTTRTPLAANLSNQDITDSLVRYRFNDGINTYESSTSSRISNFKVSTDALGAISDTVIDIYQWQSEPGVGGYFNCIEVYKKYLEGHNARICLAVSGSNCTAWTNNSSTSTQGTDHPAIWIQTPSPTPQATTRIPEAGKTEVRLSNEFVGALSLAGVDPGAVRPGRLTRRGVASFPITTGAIQELKAEIDHSGGLSLSAGSVRLVLGSFIIETVKPEQVMTGLIIANGNLIGRAPLFNVITSDAETDSSGKKLSIRNIHLTLTQQAADVLNHFFGVSAFSVNFPIGTATVRISSSWLQ